MSSMSDKSVDHNMNYHEMADLMERLATEIKRTNKTNRQELVDITYRHDSLDDDFLRELQFVATCLKVPYDL